jgi:uncharacterized protein (TIGR02145 family)
MGFFNRQVWGRALLTVAAAVVGSVWSAAAQQKGTFTDKRDGKVYKTVVIGGKKWMAENLNVKTGTSWCYGNQESNCKKYGRLYSWSTAAKMACPNGWRLPTQDEWAALVKAAGGKEVAGKKLKSKSGWNDYCDSEDEDARTCFDGDGADDFGFSALPGGRRNADSEFLYAGNGGYWWTATEDGGSSAYYRGVGNDFDNVYESGNGKNNGFSARCVEE